MLSNKPYDRAAAVEYARRWALSRNPRYYDFEEIGGDCTNFASQCIYAGAGVMNYTPVTGWYYITANDRSASWTGVEYLYDFLMKNETAGPYAIEVPKAQAMSGDIVQLGTASGDFFHSPVIVAVRPEILVAAHTYDALDRPLASYIYDRARFLHIEGVRFWT
ncbi:MAG: amidase domain-containing protein [Oscillospiraceae bacterium]